MKCTRTALSITALALLIPMLSACGSSGSVDSTPAAMQSTASGERATEATTPASAVATDQTATLTWPKGTDEFALNVCASVGKNTIQGGGSTDTWNLQVDANLLNPGDEGILIVSRKPDMTVEYDAKITSLTVNPDGTFTGSGHDASQAPFTISGTCTVSWA